MHIHTRRKEPAALMLHRAAFTGVYKNIFPIRNALSSISPQVGTDRAELVIVDGHWKSLRFKNPNRRRKIFAIIGGIHPDARKIRFCKTYRFHSHEGHIAGKREISCDESRKPLQSLVVQARNYKPDLDPQAASRKVKNPLYSLVKRSVCLHDEIVFMRHVRVQRNAKNKIGVAHPSDV